MLLVSRHLRLQHRLLLPLRIHLVPALARLSSSSASASSASASAPSSASSSSSAPSALPPAPALSPEGIPLLPGEVLVHVSGAATAGVVRQSWMPTLLCSAYLGVVKGVELATPALESLLSPGWTLAFLAMTLGSSLLALGTTSLCVRAMVLTADGQALRVHPYGALMGIGLGRGVAIPLRLLRENADFGGAKRDPDALFIQVRSGGLHGTWAPAHLIVDKPPAAVVPRLAAPGSGLAFTQRGLAPAAAAALQAAAAAAAAAPAAAPGSAPVQLLPPPLSSAADRAALQRYLLLVWLLQGNCVADMARLRAGEWRAESIAVDLGEAGLGASKAGRAYQARALAAQWVAAREEEGAAGGGGGGRTYYYNKLTWERSWTPPPGVAVEGGGGALIDSSGGAGARK